MKENHLQNGMYEYQEAKISGGILEDGNHKKLYTENYKTLLRKCKDHLNTALSHVYGLKLTLLQNYQLSPNSPTGSTQSQ